MYMYVYLQNGTIAVMRNDASKLGDDIRSLVSSIIAELRLMYV